VNPIAHRNSAGGERARIAAMRRLGIDARKLADFGIGTYIQGLLGELVELVAETEVVLFVAPGRDDLLPPLPERWKKVSVEAAGYTLREQFVMPIAAARAGVDVLHVPHYVVPLLFPGRLVVTVHDIIHVLFPEFVPSGLGFAYARFMIRAAVRRGRRVIAVSESTAADLRRLFGASGERLRVIPNGVQAAFLAAPKRVEDRRLLDALSIAPPYLLHVGNHKPHKNVESVLKAYQLLVHDQEATPPLVLAGGFAPDGPLAARARGMGLEGRVRCLGHVDQHQLAALYRGATVFVYPTLYEGFGLPVLEAMACGVPVVAGNVAAVREVAGDAIMRVNPRDVRELATALRRLLGQPGLRARLGRLGREVAHGYRWRRSAEATLAVYRAVQEEA
jgi:glycosyltransferase involved in cell wall biosynthesis